MLFTSPFQMGVTLSLLLLCTEVVFAQNLVPRPPRTFDLTSSENGMRLEWTTFAGSPDPANWEIYRTTEYEDNLPYELIQELPGSARNFTDSEFIPNTGYFYYIQAVGEPTTPDPLGLTGTPDGQPFRSSRYLTVTADLSAVGVRPGLDPDSLYAAFPNPFREETRFQYVANGPAFMTVRIYNILGQEVVSLYDDFIEGFNTDVLAWDGRDHTGRRVASGIYYCQLALNLPAGPIFEQYVPIAYIK